MRNKEFYIGYLPKAPRAIARFRGRVVVALLILLPSTAALVAAVQARKPAGLFEFGVEKMFEGQLEIRPIATLHSGHDGDEIDFLLVGLGKFGYSPSAEYNANQIRVRGSLIQRGTVRMIEVHQEPERIQQSKGGHSELHVESTSVDLVGELVDTKCYLGVMRPAMGKVHRACAVRCLSGGIPPGLLTRDTLGNSRVFVLVGSDGEALTYDVEWGSDNSSH